MTRSTKSRAKKQATRKWEAKFLEAFRRHKSITHACRAAHLDPSTVYKWRKESESFADKWDEIYNEITDLIETSAVNRAADGWEEPVFYQGAICGTVRKYSDVLQIFMLKKRKAEVYGDKPEKARNLDDLKTRVLQTISEMEEELDGE